MRCYIMMCSACIKLQGYFYFPCVNLEAQYVITMVARAYPNSFSAG